MKFTLIIWLIFIFSVALYPQIPSTATGEEQKTESEVKAIAITDITSRADMVHTRILEILKDLEPKSDIQAIEEQVPVMVDSLKNLRHGKKYTLLNELDTRTLKNLQQEWSFYRTELSDWQKTLSAESQKLERTGIQLNEMSEIWYLTRQEARADKAPTQIQRRINNTINKITDAKKQLSGRLNALLINQNLLSENINKINEQVADFKKAEEELSGKLFVKDSPGLWQLISSEKDSLGLISQFQKSGDELIRTNLAFINLNRDRFYFHILLFILLLSLMVYLYVKNKKNQLLSEDDQTLKAPAYFIARPLAASFMIALMLSIWIYPASTTTVTEFIMLLLLFPILRLMNGVFSLENRYAIYGLAFLMLLNLLQRNAFGMVLFQRITLLLSSIVCIIVTLWLIRPAAVVRQRELRAWPRLLLKSSPVIIVLLVVSIFANIYGSVSLAGTLTWGIIESAYILVTVYIAAAVVNGLVKVLIRRRRIQAMQFLKTYAQNMEKWAEYLITFIAFFIWIRAILRITGLLDPISEAYTSFLAYQWSVGELTISVNAVVDFILILIGTFVISRLIRVLMDMEVFPRLKLKKGLPSAINMVIRYILIALGILLALSAVGIDLGKFGLLAGALGVGLGFGLQKIVANFISSLLIAFGQLIRVGDVLEYGGAMGNVTNIGVNSSTMRTFDGSELIIPNADLISNNVTNWTLSDGIRRMQLAVKVDFGNDPHRVLELITKVVVDHEDVLPNPAPFAVFNGFGDYFLDFTLYYWIPTSLFFKAKSEVALNVYDILKNNGISAPRPQGDFNLTMKENLPIKRASRKKPVTSKEINKK